MKTYEVQTGIYVAYDLNENETRIVNELLKEEGLPKLEEWGGTEYSLQYDPKSKELVVCDSVNELFRYNIKDWDVKID